VELELEAVVTPRSEEVELEEEEAAVSEALSRPKRMATPAAPATSPASMPMPPSMRRRDIFFATAAKVV